MHCIFYIFDPNTKEYEKEDVKYTAVILFLTVINTIQSEYILNRGHAILKPH